MPAEYGGAGLGVTEAAIMMHEVASHGGGMAAASSVHINLFGPHPIVVFGTPEQKAALDAAAGAGPGPGGLRLHRARRRPQHHARSRPSRRKVDGGYLVHGQKVWTTTAQVASKIMLLTRTTTLEDCARPTDGISIFYTDLDRSKIDVRRIPKMGRKAVDSNAIFIDGLFIPEADRIGEEGKGFAYILHSLNPERLLIAAEAIGIGQDALRRATNYAARARRLRPADRPEPGHPASAGRTLDGARERPGDGDEGRLALRPPASPAAPRPTRAKFLGARAGYDACQQAVLTHGGFGYAKEYHVERLLREVMITRIAPVTEQLILSFIAEKVLDLPKSY